MSKVQSRKKPELEWNEGVFFLDKPAGMSSFALVKRVRYLLGIKKVGHAGTLDPFATGLMIICVGRAATRCIDQFMSGRKTYLARLQLGVETTTQDPEGEIIATRPVPELGLADIALCLAQHTGPQMQAPPPFSAAKHKGKPLYAYAREGIMIQKDPKPIEIYALEQKSYDPLRQELVVEVCCSRGTYVRVLAADIGTSLGCGAHLIGLRRTASGAFDLENCLTGDQLFSDEGLSSLCAARRSISDVMGQIEQNTD
nr:tRNA pseudouridine(55) synthase TruB [uncultured Desulfobulbus sp.]